MPRSLLSISLMVLVVPSTLIYAATVQYDAVVILEPGRIGLGTSGNQVFSQPVPSAGSVIVHPGDTLTGIISFANGLVLVQGASHTSTSTQFSTSQALGFTLTPGTLVSETFSLAFTGLTGNLPIPLYTSSGSGSIAFAYYDAYGAAPAFAFGFTGYQYAITFDGLVDNFGNSLSSTAVSLNSLRIEAASVQVLPEPASMTTMSLGLLWVGVRQRCLSRRSKLT